ncbi:hypothetical protein CsatA_027056 [Cannabis sativa]
MDARRICGVVTAIFGLISLSRSTFITFHQFNPLSYIHDTRLMVSLISVLLGFVVFNRNALMQWGTRNLSLSPTFMIHSSFHGIVLVLVFSSKHSRFAAHREYIKSCSCVEEELGETTILHGSGSQLYNLYSVGAFALLAMVLSSHSHKKIELGLFTVLLSLIIDTCMEITSNLWCLFGALLCCFGLFFLGNHESIRGRLVRYTFVIMSFEVALASVGAIFLFLSPFSEHQFKDADNLKGFIFITLTFFLGQFLSDAPNYIHNVVETCDRVFLVKTMVRFSFLLIVSVFSFMNKYYPVINMNCAAKVEKGERRNIFDVFTGASFSFLAVFLRQFETEEEAKKNASLKLFRTIFGVEIEGYDGIAETDGIGGIRGANGIAETDGIGGIGGANGIAETDGIGGIGGANGISETDGIGGIGGANGIADTDGIAERKQ